MLHAALFQKPRRKVAQHACTSQPWYCEIGVPVANTTPRRRLLAEIAGLHEHIESAIAIGIRQARDAIHFGRVEQVFIEIRLIHENLIHPQLLRK